LAAALNVLKQPQDSINVTAAPMDFIYWEQLISQGM